ncbi:hypothetical protein H9Q10_08950 [Eikenella sp. S3360]|uniref:Uncharacterized protein n=1 Tax=Eikenella glucosivorans TaxID=2766967 RepID=A0ABS0NC07_9NEIS|nr:hypothetical protein [Eikenella glucosivorans]MBH5329795.1 hypothetical protein [Eikenella glucosivorans]
MIINTQLSREIYRRLISGKTINRQVYDEKNGMLVDNELFGELSAKYDGVDGYRTLYGNIGYELVLRPDYAYLRDCGIPTDEGSETAAAVCAVLVVLGKTVVQNNYRFSLLTTADAGISEQLCRQTDQNEEMRDIQAACIKDAKTLWENAERVLVRRDIAYINAKGNLVLSNSGQDFFNTAFKQGSRESLPDIE